jgi:hypothetical protein
MNQKNAAIISEALRASLEFAPSSWHVAKINAAMRLVEAFEQPYRISFYNTIGTVVAKDFREARSIIQDNHEPWTEARVLRLGRVTQIWRKDQEDRPYRSV